MTREEALAGILFPDARSHIANHFSVYAEPQFIARFMARYELLKLVQDVPGSIIECGVAKGFGFFASLQIGRILNPHNLTRVFIGFDTFAGFPSVSPNDDPETKVGEQQYGVPPEHLSVWGELQSRNWAIVMRESDVINPANFKIISQNLALVIGDFVSVGPKFFAENPHILCALLYLDFDLYEPTKAAIEMIVPRMPKGAVIAFDELNIYQWRGETLALMDTLGVSKLRLKRFPFEPTMSYAVIE